MTGISSPTGIIGKSIAHNTKDNETYSPPYDPTSQHISIPSTRSEIRRQPTPTHLDDTFEPPNRYKKDEKETFTGPSKYELALQQRADGLAPFDQNPNMPIYHNIDQLFVEELLALDSFEDVPIWHVGRDGIGLLVNFTKPKRPGDLESIYIKFGSDKPGNYMVNAVQVLTPEIWEIPELRPTKSTHTSLEFEVSPRPNGSDNLEATVVASTTSYKPQGSPSSEYVGPDVNPTYAGKENPIGAIMTSSYSPTELMSLFSYEGDKEEEGRKTLERWIRTSSLVPEKGGNYSGKDVVYFAISIRRHGVFRKLGYEGEMGVDILKQVGSDLKDWKSQQTSNGPQSNTAEDPNISSNNGITYEAYLRRQLQDDELAIKIGLELKDRDIDWNYAGLELITKHVTSNEQIFNALELLENKGIAIQTDDGYVLNPTVLTQL